MIRFTYFRIHLLTFLLSFVTFLFYFKSTFLHLNDKLTSLEGDAIKNYYTFLFHTIKDNSIFQFNGMNFPYGELPPFADCQPLLSAVLHYLPFTYPYLVGIMHGLLLFSFIITPNILLKIFKWYEIDNLPAVLSSLAIGLLSPQIHRIDSHFALAYGCIVPLSILFNLKLLRSSTLSSLLALFSYNSLLFFMHPYLGFGCSLFSLCIQATHALYKFYSSRFSWKELGSLVVAGILPVLLFTLIMQISDYRTDRPTEPYGIDVTMAKPSSIFVPIYGPFQHFMKLIIKTEFRHWEGFAYVGLFVNFMIVFFIANLLILRKRLKFNAQLTAVMIGATGLLLFSFGVQNLLMDWINIEIPALRQFRALGRFSWYFYFSTPVFLIITLTHTINNTYGFRLGRFLCVLFPSMFFLLNHIEGYDLLKPRANYLTQPNLFLKNSLNNDWQTGIESVNGASYQAILPIPQFYIGSEMYERKGIDSVYKTFILSFHTGLPILSSMMSRTSCSETRNGIQRINPPLNNKRDQYLQWTSLLVLKANQPLKPSEELILQKASPFFESKTMQLSVLSYSSFFANTKTNEVTINKCRYQEQNIYFVADSNEVPFTTTKNSDYGMLVLIDSNRYQPGRYVLSFDYFFEGLKFENIDCAVVIERKRGIHKNG